MANEAFACQLAAELDLPVCEPFFVEIEPQFAAAIQDASIRQLLQSSCSVCFGSKSAGKGWKAWTSGDLVHSNYEGLALAITAFDAFIENDDRRPVKPNLLVRGDEWRIIDHELAFRLRLKLFPRPAPWTHGYLNKLVSNQDGHILALCLKGRASLDFSDVQTSWGGLTDARLKSFVDALPSEWNSAVSDMWLAVDHLKKVRADIGACVGELKRVLA